MPDKIASAPETAPETVVVLGASGGIGREIVAELVARRYQVIAVARNADPLKALAQRVNDPARLLLRPGSVATDFDAGQLVQGLRSDGARITAVVAALRGPQEGGRLLDQPAPALLRALEADVVAPFIAARHFLPLLTEHGDDGLYLMLGGPMASCAWAGYGHLSVAGAALQMLTQVIREEAKDLPVIVQELQIGTPVRSERNANCACPEWTRAEDVARRVVALIERRDRGIPIVQLGSYRGAQRAAGAPALRSTSAATAALSSRSTQS